ncbi:hypothetical protein [Algoriphagus sp. AK58]|uniref:hypothetical protein n=1 Tax=Algoriphagus sp. AK58 TaxID=1406877 RepID=UPI00164EF9CE|nr:hypothetical protein [Algoriphagus sp. AK58]MBC6365278.1 hypothetical protein [Algoriphagus sp. AK58]
MEQDMIQSLLAQVFGQLQAESSQEKKSFDEGLKEFARAIQFQSPESVNPRKLTIQSADFFFQSKLPKTQLLQIEKITAEVAKEEIKESDTRVFIRETPIRSTQIEGSVPAWGQGAKVERTIGPLTRVDGRQVFLDVYRVVKLVALRKQGTNEPLILFKAQFSEPRIKKVGAAPVEITDTYKVVQGSVWIKASLLASNAPNDRYIGLHVKSGEIKLSAPPTLQGQHLIVANSTSVTTHLEIQPTAATSIPKNKHGIDAHEATLATPGNLSFVIGGASAQKINAAGNASWNIYGKPANFSFQGNKLPTFSPQLNRVLIPYHCNESIFKLPKVQSPLVSLEGEGQVTQSWWGIPAATLDINAPLEAAGAGGLVQDFQTGVKASWKGMEGNPVSLGNAQILVDPGRIAITALQGSSLDSFQKFEHWKDHLNPYGTQVLLSYPSHLGFLYNSTAEGVEVIISNCHSDVQIDRPKQVNGHAVAVKTKDSLVLFAASDKANLLYLIDDNVLWDNKLPFDKVPKFKNIALALENALFTVSPVNGVMIFGKCDKEWKKITDSQTFLAFGLLSYLPTLPDPYLANFGIFGRLGTKGGSFDQITQWMFCRIIQKSVLDQEDEVKVSFHFGQGTAQTSNASIATRSSTSSGNLSEMSSKIASASLPEIPVSTLKTITQAIRENIPDYEEEYSKKASVLDSDFFALIDVSSNANQMGVSMGMNPVRRKPIRETTGVARITGEGQATIQSNQEEIITIDGMQVKVPGHYARVFLLPQVAWEPTWNTAKKEYPMDPHEGFNYYPNDGGPSRILNSSVEKVTLAPIPLTQFLVEKFQQQKTDLITQFTLPFGLKSVGLLDHSDDYRTIKPKLEFNAPSFSDGLIGGIQIRAIGGDSGKEDPNPKLNDFPMFKGFTFQLNNILDLFGNPTKASNLGDSVTRIFNGEFAGLTGDPKGVPVTTIDFTGYGASVFSNWLSPTAAIASTSQAKFDVFLGRTAHEIIQVKSIVYPWAIRVVRTITLFRASSGFIYRMDSGWQPESDGRFDFRYNYWDTTVSPKKFIIVEPYDIYPGVLKGLFNIKNIKEDASLADFQATDYVKKGSPFINVMGEMVLHNKDQDKEIPIFCRPVWFDADVELENLVQGHKNNRTPAKKILGYVQLAPTGFTLTPQRFKQLLDLQGGLIGGDIDCIMDINKSGQQIRLTRFDFSHAWDDKNSKTIFVAAARGSAILPKTGSWSMVQHNVGTGEVTQLPNHIPIPLVRDGKWTPDFYTVSLGESNKLIRMAAPSELLRYPVSNTVNFGILQTTSTQKALVLTPSFHKGEKKLFSKTPLLFADAYSLMSGNSIFPNAGNAIDEFGKAFPLLTGVDNAKNKFNAFLERNDIDDLGSNVLELMSIEVQKQGQSIVDQGFELLAGKANQQLNKALAFDLPPFKTYLVDMEALKIYIEYVTKKTQKDASYVDGKLNFDINSFANDAAKTWKSRLNNLSMVVDLGSFEGLMRIKGNFDAQKGKEAGFPGEKDSDFPSLGYPTPEIEFHDSLQPVIDILQMLASLNEGRYGDVMKKGLEIAMSNAGEIWEYKFEAKKEIPLVRFPPEQNLYDAPTTPLKLEAGLELGVYFNAALKVTTDPKQLLPTAGAYIQFRGGLQVMCASIGAGTIFAVGEVVLKLACDTKIGPSLAMKFGFGASIAVGLPVIGTLSVTYIVGCELYASLEKITVTAYMLFKGRASLAGGLVSVTIYIEASGSVERIPAQDKTNCTASVTFGLDISICFVINISFEETWQETRQIA